MDAPVTLTSAFLLGVFTTLHCVGMCGGIIGALSLSLSPQIRESKPRLLLFVGMYNIGRIISYSLAGLIAGALGAEILASSGFKQGNQIFHYLGISMMIAVGLYLTGWLPQLARVEKIGIPLWKKLEPVGRRLLPVNNPVKALGYGFIWGWLPCGMVYFALIWSLSAGSAYQGALIMLAFGLGTLPTLLTAGFMTSWITKFARNSKVRASFGLLVIAMAVGSLFIPMGHQHQHGTQDENMDQKGQMDHSQHQH